MAARNGSDRPGDGARPSPDRSSRSSRSRPKSPVDQWFELFVYAPLGFALDARQLFPRFVDRGRSQVVLARVVGKYAVQHGQTRAERYLGDSQTQLAAVLQALGLLPEEHEPDADGQVTAFERGEVTFAGPAAGADDRREPEPQSELDAELGPAGGVPEPGEAPAGATPAEVPDVSELAIPDYDNLSASQVVPRLGGLSPEELEAVRRYEVAVRGRKTILGKISQLQSA